MGSLGEVRADKEDVREGCGVVGEGKLMVFVPGRRESRMKREEHVWREISQHSRRLRVGKLQSMARYL